MSSAPTTPAWVRARARARTRTFRDRFGRARDAVAEFVVEHGPVMLCWSGGKDSTALACVAEGIEGVHLVHYESGLEFPGVLDYMAEAAASRGWPYGAYRVGDALEVMVENGSWDHDAPPAEYDADRFWYVVTAGPHAAAAAEIGPGGMMWGLRQDESRRRGHLLRSTRGRFRNPESGLPVFCPLWAWTVEDVWAAHAVRGVAPCPVYVRLTEVGCPQDEQRTDLMVGSDGRQFGRFAWLRAGWPEEYVELARRLPRIAEWT